LQALPLQLLSARRRSIALKAIAAMASAMFIMPVP
jgi:hypothetical protein